MVAIDRQLKVAVLLAVADHIETAPIFRNRFSMNSVILTKAKADILKTREGIHSVLIVAVRQNSAGGQLGKLAEGFLHILQILKVIQVIRLNVQHHSQRREEIQERITVLAAFQHNGIAIAHPMTGMKQRQISADHHRGIHLSGHQNVRHHGSSSRLAVGAGNAHSIAVGLHNHAPGLRTLKDRDAVGTGVSDLRVVIMYRGSADDAIRTDHIFRMVTNGYRDPLGEQLIRRPGMGHIGAGHLQAHAL